MKAYHAQTRTLCLSKDSRLIVSHVGLRRMRKGLLSDLSTLVKAAKKLQEGLHSEVSRVQVFEYMDDLVLKSFKLVTRAVRFLDIWATDAVSLSLFELGDATSQRPPTPPSDSTDAVVQQSSGSINTSADGFPTNEYDSPITQASSSHQEDWYGSSSQPQRSLNRLSVAFSLPSEADSLQSPISFSQPHSHAHRLSISHRLSYTSKSLAIRRDNLASERLSTTQDGFLGFIGSFIGSHLQSRSSEELTQITQHSVAACRQFLVVIEEIWERDSRRSLPLEEARDNMYARLTDLVQATKNMFNELDTHPGEDVVAPDAGRQLVAAATGCVRAAGDCVAKARLVIEKIGDFEFEVAGLGLSGVILQKLDSDRLTHEPEPSCALPETTLETEKPLPAPPAEANEAEIQTFTAATKPLPKVPQLSLQEQDRVNLLAPVPTNIIVESPTAISFRSSRSSLPALQILPTPLLPPPTSNDSLESPMSVSQGSTVESSKMDSSHVSVADSAMYQISSRAGSGSIVSQVSTRATTPEQSPNKKHSSQTLVSSFGSSSELRSMVSEDIAAGEEHLLETTYVHELVYNKEGQISGGSLPALVEQLTTFESTPDAVFVNTFYLTFRLFTTPVDLARCLIDRFDYIGDSQKVGVPVRLRVYNVFKGWLESHWSNESDSAALEVISSFASGKMQESMPAAGKRLLELTSKVTEVRAGALVPRLVSSIGKTGTSTITLTPADNANAPSPIITRSQLNALRACKEGKSQCSILDFDPLELARQFTIIESRLFCAIQPEELLALEWTKKTESKAHNVKAMSTLSTDLANLVADTILQLEDAKKRAVVIKQWVKIAAKCLELNNYDSLMAIICSLNSSMVNRLRRTWELVSTKTKARLEELKTVTDVGRNYAVLRQRLQNHVAPCIPFVGIYLTDLTFIDVGNHKTRQLPGESDSDGVSVINFDKHMKTAKIIGQLQSFQVPYRLSVIPEMQDWMEAQIHRMRVSDEANVQSYYRRSLLLEPREVQHSLRGSPSIDNSAQSTFSVENRTTSREKFEFLNFNFSTTNLRGS